MKRNPYFFLSVLLLLLTIVFGVHLMLLYFNGLPIFNDRIVLSYILNYVLAAIVLVIIQSKFNKKSSQTGFIFMGGSGLKFLFFFLLLYPFYQRDGLMSTSEFAAFFVPYASCLILEVIYLSKQLNNQES